MLGFVVYRRFQRGRVESAFGLPLGFVILLHTCMLRHTLQCCLLSSILLLSLPNLGILICFMLVIVKLVCLLPEQEQADDAEIESKSQHTESAIWRLTGVP